MSNTKKNQVHDRRGTLVLELEVSDLRAAQMAFDDCPAEGQLRPIPRADPTVELPAPARFRVVVSLSGSDVSVYYQDLDVVGDLCWELLSNGVCFSRMPHVTFWRRVILAEAFRRLAADGPRQVWVRSDDRAADRGDRHQR